MGPAAAGSRETTAADSAEPEASGMRADGCRLGLWCDDLCDDACDDACDEPLLLRDEAPWPWWLGTGLRPRACPCGAAEAEAGCPPPPPPPPPLAEDTVVAIEDRRR